jgi:hypothetical protein
MDSALIGVCGTLGGTVLGSGLTWWLSKDATKKEREHQTTELIRQRRESMAGALSADLEDLSDALPKPAASWGEASAQFQAASVVLGRCERRAQFIQDPVITDRLAALNYGLFIAADEAEEREDEKGNINIWALRWGMSELQAAVVAYQLRQDAPAGLFPTSSEQRELIGDEPGGMGKLNRAVRLRWIAARKEQTGE